MATADKRQTFEAGPQGVIISASNSAGGGDAFSSVLVEAAGQGVYDSAASRRGVFGAHVTGVANDTFGLYMAGTAAASASAQVYFRFNAIPAVVSEFFGFRSSTGNVVRFVIGITGVLSLQNASGTGIRNFNSNSPLAANTWYRLQLQATKGASATDGYAAGQLYSEDGTLIDSFSSNTVNVGTADITTVRLGKVTAISDNFDMSFDDLGFSTGTAEPLDPVQDSVVVTADAGETQVDVEPWSTVTLDGSGSSAQGGEIAAYDWQQANGPAVELIGAGAMRTFTAPGSLNEEALIFELTVTGNDGSNDTDVVSVTILPATNFYAKAGSWQPLQITRL